MLWLDSFQPTYTLRNSLQTKSLYLAVGMVTASSVLSATSKRCFEQSKIPSNRVSFPSATSKQYFELLVSSIYNLKAPAASFLVCSLIFIEYY
ncbi:hypothetical protein [Streptococcus pneumoniae]|uniref:hypothetical protein n=1 Tax=Streptococcus pneumoniae TaxID=1313 RepID=UPI000AE3FBE8|nr:hypothetical protein [Streptococcus pneumoniae]